MIDWFETLVDPYPEAEMRAPPKRLIPFLWACARGMRPYLLLMTLLTGITGAFEALLFYMLGDMLNWLGQVEPAHVFAQERGRLLVLACILFGSPLVIALQTTVKHQTLAVAFPMRLRWNFHRLMLGQSMSFFQDEFAGRVAAKVMQTALAVRESWMILGDIMVFVIVYFVTMVAVVGSFDKWLLIPYLVWAAAYVGALIYFVPRLAKIAAAQADARSLMTGRVTDAYTNISTVKLFSHGRREAAYARAAMDEFMVSARQQMRFVTGFEIINHTLSMVLIAGTAGEALWLWSHGQLALGSLAAATAMALRLNGISHWVMWELATLFEHVGTVQDGLNTLSRDVAIRDRDGSRTLQAKAGEIRFEDVSFAYGGKTSVINNLNLVIRPGEKIGLVGRSGAGKSTIVNLLLRFYDVEKGRILIDGQDIALVTQTSLRAQIGMVTQDTSLLHRSVRDNILYGRPDATEAQMLSAAENAHAAEFIAGLTDPRGRRGYEAHVGERGVKLSGGQRQRIAIARVMLKDAPILLLDEATSALDSEVEAAIQDALVDLMRGKTVVAIAHRLSTIAAMDRLVVIDHGRIVEEGDHASLLAQGGLYAQLWARQSGGFLGDGDDDDRSRVEAESPTEAAGLVD